MSTANLPKTQDVNLYQKYKEHQEKTESFKKGGLGFFFFFI